MILNRRKKKEKKTVSYAPGTGVKNARIGWNAFSRKGNRLPLQVENVAYQSYTTCFQR